MDPALNPHGIRAIRDTVWIVREDDLTVTRYLKSDLVPPHLRERYIAEKRTGLGVVIAVGDGEWQNGIQIKPEVQVGDRVIFGPFAGQDLKLPDGTEYFTIYSKDIRGILPPVPAEKARRR